MTISGALSYGTVIMMVGAAGEDGLSGEDDQDHSNDDAHQASGRTENGEQDSSGGRHHDQHGKEYSRLHRYVRSIALYAANIDAEHGGPRVVVGSALLTTTAAIRCCGSSKQGPQLGLTSLQYAVGDQCRL
jgi:hypothetical protein